MVRRGGAFKKLHQSGVLISVSTGSDIFIKLSITGPASLPVVENEVSAIPTVRRSVLLRNTGCSLDKRHASGAPLMAFPDFFQSTLLPETAG